MAREPLPPKAPIPDRVREPLSGIPRNAELQAAILERGRAELVEMYRKNPAPWPDGIDHPGNRWYGDGSAWTEERIKAALDDSVFGDKPKVKPKIIVVPTDAVVKAGRPKDVDRQYTLTAKEPWKAAGMSKATWYRRREKRGE